MNKNAPYWLASKEFHFEFGHRVWSQSVIENFSLSTECKCRHLHGHSGALMVSLYAQNLKSGMVTDFHNLNWFKDYIDREIDHKFLFDRKDPLLPVLIPNVEEQIKKGHFVLRSFGEMSWSKDIECSDLERELYEGLVILPFLPTSENLAKWFYEIVDKKMGEIGIGVGEVTFSETKKSKCTFSHVGQMK